LNLRRLISRRAGLHVIHDLYVEDVLIRLLAAQMHVTLGREGVLRVHREGQPAETVARHLGVCGVWKRLIRLVLNFISDEELDIVLMHEACSDIQRESEFAAFFNLVEKSHS
jgi:hypothetical protein